MISSSVSLRLPPSPLEKPPQAAPCHLPRQMTSDLYASGNTVRLCGIYKIEMTLDRGFFTPPIKGHLCSLLISNIFLNPLFLQSAVCIFPPDSLTLQNFISLARIPSVFLSIGSSLGESFRPALVFFVYIMRSTAVFCIGRTLFWLGFKLPLDLSSVWFVPRLF